MLLALLVSGCVTIGTAQQGSMPAADAISGLKRGDSLPSVVARLGAPVESWRHPGGVYLVYRARTYDYDRLGLDPTRALSFLSISSTTALDALSNLRLTLERGDLTEARLAVLFDAHDRLLTAAYRGPQGERTP